MKERLQINADRFLGFADIYDSARPRCPEKVTQIILKYLGEMPLLVVDLGCGTGLSSRIWSKISNKVIGIEPSKDMIEIAKEKASDLENITFISSFSDKTGLEGNSADIVTCSQSFHWMNPETTLNEVQRILKKGGIFAVYDCDWPPIYKLEIELEYTKLFEKVREIESRHPAIKDKSIRWDKDKHLSNIKNSGHFQYAREIVFSNTEICNAQRVIEMALSQGGLQAIIKAGINEINPYIDSFKMKVFDVYGNDEFEVEFCYRMRLGIK
ncbi:class I SAM-dependent methyltransferase [Clostridium paridis]|uniref:Class I SAM-dependent methyltransferase n=1 Tax=Clostridium paridis TaxID=2803863 RepID=A0A937K3S1_9CLOT|nr:class I SAM-dependent methyltransferase [Clostridium paridis]MBL4930375.1 class I SAM-dependent methyltransferase [Clostridium paridis]